MPPSDAARGYSGWMSLGACRQEDPEMFFPIAATGAALHQIDAAKAVCQGCAVQAACLSFGLETRQDGIWGGTTWEERYAMRRQLTMMPGGQHRVQQVTPAQEIAPVQHVALVQQVVALVQQVTV